MNVFAMTIVYNESFYLPLWVKYYGAQVGLENLFVVDHGSTDLSTQGLGPVNIVRVPRKNYDEVQRILFASDMHAGLLKYYDGGFVVDPDEFIIADPAKYRNLRDFAERTSIDAPACIGFELFHIRASEGAYRECLPILSQRRHVLFDSWMCKRSFSRVRIRFGGGFHTSDQPVQFDDDLYLIHIKNFDYQYRLVRQGITQSWNYSDEKDFGDHARRSLEYVDAVFAGVDIRVKEGLVTEEFDFKELTAQCIEKTVLNPSSEYDFNYKGGFQSEKLHLLPSRFQGLF